MLTREELDKLYENGICVCKLNSKCKYVWIGAGREYICLNCNRPIYATPMLLEDKLRGCRFDFNRTIFYYRFMRHKDENKSESIFNAAIQLINEHGLSETSMSKIAKKAGVSASTIYVYFENKEDMLNKLYLSVKKKMSLEVFYNYDDSISLQSAFEHALRKFINFILTHKDEFLFVEQFSNSPLLHKLSLKEGTELFQPIFSLLEKGKSHNVFKQVDTSLLHMFMFNPAMQYAKAYFGGQIELEQEMTNELIQMSWDALKA